MSILDRTSSSTDGRLVAPIGQPALKPTSPTKLARAIDRFNRAASAWAKTKSAWAHFSGDYSTLEIHQDARLEIVDIRWSIRSDREYAAKSRAEAELMRLIEGLGSPENPVVAVFHEGAIYEIVRRDGEGEDVSPWIKVLDGAGIAGLPGPRADAT